MCLHFKMSEIYFKYITEAFVISRSFFKFTRILKTQDFFIIDKAFRPLKGKFINIVPQKYVPELKKYLQYLVIIILSH